MSQGLMKVQTARRREAEALVDLRQRRAWYDETPPAGEPPPSEPAGGTTPPGAGDPPAGGEAVPDWVKDPAKAYAEIVKLRGENAQKRVEKKTPADPAKPAGDKPTDDAQQDRVTQLQADFRKLQGDLQAEKLTNLRFKIANEAGLPVELAARLQGTTEDELKADAEKLKPFVPKVEDPPAPGGRGRMTTPIPGGNPANETDAQKRARLFGR